MQLEEVAKALKELGHPTRLFIFKHLVKAGEQGLPVGELQKQLGIPGSTLSHHISALVSVGLVKQNRANSIYGMKYVERSASGNFAIYAALLA